MVYVTGLLLCIVVLAILSFGPVGVRKLAFVCASCFGFAFWYVNRADPVHRPAASGVTVEAAKVRVDGLFLAPLAVGGYEVRGKVSNNSSVALSGIGLDVSLQDCGSVDPCRVVGKRTISVALAVPPGETKNFRSSPFAFVNLPSITQNRSSNIKFLRGYLNQSEFNETR